MTRDVPQTTLQIFSGVFFFFNDNGMFFKEVKILVIRLLDLSIVGFEINGYGGGWVWSPTKQTQNFWDWVGGATQGDKGMMGTRENIIECMYKGTLVILFHVCLMMFWTLNMVLFLAFDMELHF